MIFKLRATPEFISDGCSGGMSWFFIHILHELEPWHCDCIKHDQEYWLGGAYRDRRQADRDLAIAVISKGYFWWGVIMYIGVRIGGSPWWPFSWRWGYRYKYLIWKQKEDSK